MYFKGILSAAYFSLLVGCSPSAPNSIDSVPKNTTLSSAPPPSQAVSQPKILKPPANLGAPTNSTLNYQIQTYRSQVWGSDRTYGIVLPPEYEQQTQAQYPVIFLLHGGHGDPTAWFIKGKALKVIERLYASGKLPPSIIVTPDGNDSRGTSALWDPEYVNGQYGNVLSAIGDELVQEIKTRYRTLPDPAFWAIGGLSSGGWGALNVGLHHPQNFKTLFSHSGYFIDKSGTENSPIDFIRTLDPKMRRSLAIYLDAGEGDGKYLEQSREFHQVLNQLEVENQFNEFPGGHGVKGQDVGWGFWHKHLADSLTYVGERFREAEANRSISKR
ncbi:MAG: esterase [Leptolyngbya sp. ERB_1_1]